MYLKTLRVTDKLWEMFCKLTLCLCRPLLRYQAKKLSRYGWRIAHIGQDLHGKYYVLRLERSEGWEWLSFRLDHPSADTISSLVGKREQTLRFSIDHAPYTNAHLTDFLRIQQPVAVPEQSVLETHPLPPATITGATIEPT